ncbi:Carboxypeptidase [Mycena venus]|uniref:Carboxypeptidase n=1 Tax=Mycena venus TaxID=2733690 RepID=A0A8H6XA00_9AGAR|nr:Carboxypeptidase [Mycena venus]
MVPRSLLSISFAAVLPYALATQNWSSPAHYPGKPTGGYSPEWQNYFEVTDPLENVTWPLPRNWAGSISTRTVGRENNTAFFWGFEKTNGSLIDTNSTEPWMIFLAGGPGTRLAPNNNSWHNIADIFFVDNPVGTGYSTVGRGGYPADQEQVATDFLGFLHGLVKVFPTLKTRPLHLVGESYAGRFIPYILKAYFGIDPADRPVTFTNGKIGCANPALSESSLFENIPVVRVIETYPQLINYDTKMYDYLREQAHICRFDLNLTYPQTGGKLPYTPFTKGHRVPQLNSRALSPRSQREMERGRREWMRETFGEDEDVVGNAKSNHGSSPSASASKRKLKKNRKTSKTTTATATLNTAPNQFPGIPPFNTTLTGEMNPFWGCDLLDTVMVYALNLTYPWNQLGLNFDFFDIPYTVNPITENLHPHYWMNYNTTRAALHAPRNKIWQVTTTTYSWGNAKVGTDPSPPSTSFMDELAANATKDNVGIVWYSGNDDALTTHWSTEVVIQNTTFGGIQGFTVKPNTSWFDDAGLYAGVVRQERGWTYALLYGAGHQTPVINPARSFAFIRDFFIGNSQVGAVDPETGAITMQPAPAGEGVEIPDILPDGVITGQAEVHYLTETVRWPEATVRAWNSHVRKVLGAEATPTGTKTKMSMKTRAPNSGASVTTTLMACASLV